MATMKFDLDKALIELERRQMLRLRAARGVRVACRAGMLWVTQEGRLEDQFIAPGSSSVIESDGLVLIEALEPSRATLDSAAPVRDKTAAPGLIPA